MENPALGPAGERSGSEESAFKYYARVFSKRKFVALGFALCVLAATAYQTKKQIPKYEATVTLMIERKPPRVLAGTAEVVELGNTNYWSNKEYYQTQYRIIQSQEISLRVVKRLGLMSDTRFTEELLSNRGTEEGGEVSPLTMEDLATVLSSRIVVKPVKDSMLVQISLRDAEPAFAAELVNAVGQAYLSYNLDHKQRAVAQADRELERLVGERRSVKEESEKAVIAFETKERVGTITNERKVIDQALLSGEIELAAIRREADRIGARLRTVRRFKNSENLFEVPLPDVLKNPLIRELKREYVSLSTELAKLQAVYLEKHPSILSVRGRMEVVLQSARQEVGNVIAAVELERERIQVEERNLVNRLTEYRQSDIALADRQIEHDRLLSLRSQAQQAFEKVNKRLIETKMTGEINVNNVHILDLARVPESPISPNVKLNLLLGLLLGALGGSAAALIVEMMDNTVKTREEVEVEIGLHFLGLIPTLNDRAQRGRRQDEPYDGPPELFVHYRPMSTIAEFSRSIRTNLRFLSPDTPLRTFLVTSPSPQEGKTTIAVNIGINMAAAGERTIIVDTDMRRPRLHEAFMDERPLTGISNFLIGSESIVQYCQRTEVDELDILPCGPCPPNPAELLLTERFKEMIRELQEHYSCVIFDSPPVNLVTDPQIVGNMVDGVVLVAKCGKTTRESLSHSKRQLEQANARILGCVLNDLDLEQRTYGYYYQASGTYGYIYGEDEGTT